MALLDEAKKVAKQEIMAAVGTVSKSSGLDMRIRTIKYTQNGNKVTASALICSEDKSVKVNRSYSTNPIADVGSTAKKIQAAFGLQDIFAADEDGESGGGSELDPIIEPDLTDGPDVGDAVDDLADAVNDIQDELEDIQEDDPTIQAENNIEGHLIAECDKCSGIFISAMIKSDQKVDSITGVCPLCGKESIQKFNWYVAKLEYEDGTPFNI